MHWHETIPHVSDAGWQATCVRGAAALLFGVVALAFPELGVAALLGIFAFYLVLDSIFVFVLAGRAARRHRQVWPYVLEGIADLCVALAIFVAPDFVVLGFVYLVAFWAILTGLIAASPLLFSADSEQRMFLGIYSFLSVVWGCLLFVFPRAGAVALVWWLAAYAFLIGVLLVAEGLARRREMRRLQRL